MGGLRCSSVPPVGCRRSEVSAACARSSGMGRETHASSSLRNCMAARGLSEALPMTQIEYAPMLRASERAVAYSNADPVWRRSRRLKRRSTRSCSGVAKNVADASFSLVCNPHDENDGRRLRHHADDALLRAARQLPKPQGPGERSRMSAAHRGSDAEGVLDRSDCPRYFEVGRPGPRPPSPSSPSRMNADLVADFSRHAIVFNPAYVPHCSSKKTYGLCLPMRARASAMSTGVRIQVRHRQARCRPVPQARLLCATVMASERDAPCTLVALFSIRRRADAPATVGRGWRARYPRRRPVAPHSRVRSRARRG
jgi:hypothetical protein